MAHIEEGMLQAYLDDEVGARAEIDAHLSACATCTAELNRLRTAAGVFSAAWQEADVPAPALPAFVAVRRGLPRTARLGERVRAPFARAAMFIVGFAAVASAAIPGSPVRAWIGSALRSVGVLETPPATIAPVVSDTPASAGAVNQGDDAAALAVEPVDGRASVILTNVAADANVRVRIVAGDRVLVQATGAAARARFRTGPGRIEMIGVGGGEVVVEMPANVTVARVEADGRVLFEKGP